MPYVTLGTGDFDIRSDLVVGKAPIFMIVEARIYRLQPGSRDDWTTLFQSEVRPFMESRGMKIHGCHNDLEDDNVFVWFRSFEDEATRIAQSAAVYEDPEWLEKLVPRVMPLLDGPPQVYRLGDDLTDGR